VTISERIQTARRERRVLARVSRAAWRLEQAERERTWALVSARAEGISIRTLATAIGLSPARVHQIVAAADLGRRRLVPLRRRTRPETRSPDLTNASATEAGPAPLDMIGTLPVTSINSGVSIEVVRRRLGHASTETTQLYALLDDKGRRRRDPRCAPPPNRDQLAQPHHSIAV
jgi:hypothetical protein